MSTDTLPKYSVTELNKAIGSLLDRGFAPRFIIEASVSKPQNKKGHLWLSLYEGNSSINAVIWSSRLESIKYRPEEGDNVLVVGKINFWTARASLTINILDIKPSLTTVLRKFEVVKSIMTKEGLIDPRRCRPLPKYPTKIAILTSVPSSALADMLRTTKERWPLTELLIIPIPVQGETSKQIENVLDKLKHKHIKLNIQAIVIARGGGSREDLMLFDNESLCRKIALFPIPVITGIGHEDDLTVADLVCDYRAATPTAAIVALLKSKQSAKSSITEREVRLLDAFHLATQKKRNLLMKIFDHWSENSPLKSIKNTRIILKQKNELLEALSPKKWLRRGFLIVKNKKGESIKSIYDVLPKEELEIRLQDGRIHAKASSIHKD